MESFWRVAMPACVIYRMLGLNGADRLVFATRETHCETFVEMDDISILYKPRCIIGVCDDGPSAAARTGGFMARYFSLPRRLPCGASGRASVGRPIAAIFITTPASLLGLEANCCHQPNANKLKQCKIGLLLGGLQPKVSALKSYRLDQYSVERLIDSRAALNHELRRPATDESG